jgi:hypothetical protein
MGERRGACSVLVGKYEGKKAPERPRHKRYYNIKTQIGTAGPELSGSEWWKEVGCLHGGYDTLGSVKCGEFLEWVINF